MDPLVRLRSSRPSPFYSRCILDSKSPAPVTLGVPPATPVSWVQTLQGSLTFLDIGSFSVGPEFVGVTVTSQSDLDECHVSSS